MEQKIEVKVLQELFNNKHKYFLNNEKGHVGVPDNHWGGGVQSEYNETFKFYRHPDMSENLFMRETWITDSYGENDSIKKIEFVEGKEKVVKVFESVK